MVATYERGIYIFDRSWTWARFWYGRTDWTLGRAGLRDGPDLGMGWTSGRAGLRELWTGWGWKLQGSRITSLDVKGTSWSGTRVANSLKTLSKLALLSQQFTYSI